MLWNLFIFRGFPTREHASVICDEGQGDQVYPASPHRNRYQLSVTKGRVTKFTLRAHTGTASAISNARKTKERFWRGKKERNKQKNLKVTGPGRYNLDSKKALKGEPVSLGSQQRELYFCVRSSPWRGLRGGQEGAGGKKKRRGGGGKMR